ncbi:hydroxymethylpyrimidine ABC transporter transmembrane protein [Klebsiella pneumoniae]|uniref:Hydroxymethylpyrimidine ABC transporter transmembrane protein n=1 Tax=Klebsiella pneumoniae TaxID=573 RepID=A0A3S4GVT7_KLEPN|nr:hydroxymethylpyrimidine ABC transporter transmembrane protein [Klebsiella pneumoniae]
MKNTTSTPWGPASAFSQNSLSDPRRGGGGAPVAGRSELFSHPGLSGASPLVMLESLWTHLTPLLLALLFTLKITLISFLLSIVIGAAVAFILVQNRFVETALFPYIVFLQVTPIVAIAPLIIIWVKDATLSLVVCATLMAVFPIISNTTQGLRRRLPRPAELFSPQSRQPLANAGAAAYPLGAALFLRRAAYFQWAVADWRGGGGVCRRDRRDQYRAGYQILQAGYQLDIPLMFAALLLISLAGIALFGVMSWVSRRALSAWHESEAVQSH